MLVLVAEDDDYTRNGLTEILENEGYQVVSAANGAEAIEKFFEIKPDFLCLDIMMPHKNGYQVCQEIRKINSSVPIIFLSAKSEEIDKVIGLEAGADDYIVKPFGVKEVTARIRAVTRRCIQSKGEENKPFQMNDVTVYPDSLHVSKNGNKVEINMRDLSILKFFFANANKVLSRQQIFSACWGLNYGDNTRALDQKISQLRKIIESDPQNPLIIKTAHGTGYIFEK